jgi:trimethylamine--corrinoid protein Co-methyltransferase
MLGGAEIADYVQVMIDDELCNMVNRYLQGIEVNTDTLATDLIQAAGPGGDFLDTEHTARFIRKEHFLPRLLERVTGDVESEGILVRAKDRAQEILETHKPNILSQGASEEIDKRVEEAVNSANR